MIPGAPHDPRARRVVSYSARRTGSARLHWANRRGHDDPASAPGHAPGYLRSPDALSRSAYCWACPLTRCTSWMADPFWSLSCPSKDQHRGARDPECVAISLYRQERQRSPTVNVGRMPLTLSDGLWQQCPTRVHGQAVGEAGRARSKTPVISQGFLQSGRWKVIQIAESGAVTRGQRGWPPRKRSALFHRMRMGYIG